MEDQTPHSYQVNQGDKEFIITTISLNNMLKIECRDNNIAEFPVYANSYSLNEFKQMNNFFSDMLSIIQVQTNLNLSIESQKVSIFPKNPNLMNVSFFLKDKSGKSFAITLSLQKEKNDLKSINSSQSQNIENKNINGEFSAPSDNERIDKLEED